MLLTEVEAMADGHGLMGSLVFLIFYLFLIVWLFQPTNNSLNKTEIAKRSPNNRTCDLKLVIGKSHSRYDSI